jgi:hypothetical protein
MQLILGHKFSSFECKSAFKYLSSKRVDYVEQGQELKGNGEGILCSFERTPIALYDLPTSNNMIFSRKLWENLLSNREFLSDMEAGIHYGEAEHPDRPDVVIDRICNRVKNIEIASKNLVVGDVDILDTPLGQLVYSLSKIRCGISSRGYGEFLATSSDTDIPVINPDNYIHCAFDSVTSPAVPQAVMSLKGQSPNTSSLESKVSQALSPFLHPKNSLTEQIIRSWVSFC